MKIFTVLSRDNGSFIYTTTVKELAQRAKEKQELNEAMSGGRPSVYILKSELVII